ncbi:hypothetical protein [Bacillus methanolicus]|uniref:hypothetical protein n=1 Tax=Bacillus methanolicus TaxID=1471 RepID=UPI00025F26F9|nr:hypothetical protein [Bacillus methanolicus]EIJ79754.1 hypothetical protein MGA3_15421 [Bacillus methanolicus MGA3]
MPVWFGGSFIPTAGPYIATIGFYRATEAAVFASNIRKYTDKNKHVHVTLYKDKFYGTSGRIVTQWNGQKESIKPFKVPVPKYQKIVKKFINKGFSLVAFLSFNRRSFFSILQYIITRFSHLFFLDEISESLLNRFFS